MKYASFFAALEAGIAFAMLEMWVLTGGHPAFLFLSGCALGASGTIAALRFAKPETGERAA